MMKYPNHEDLSLQDKIDILEEMKEYLQRAKEYYLTNTYVIGKFPEDAEEFLCYAFAKVIAGIPVNDVDDYITMHGISLFKSIPEITRYGQSGLNVWDIIYLNEKEYFYRNTNDPEWVQLKIDIVTDLKHKYEAQKEITKVSE